MNWKVGDWCLFEFTLHTIKEMEGNKITSVSDGNFQTGGCDLSDRVFPLTIRNKRISDTFEYYSGKFHEIHHVTLNFPDIHNYLVEKWCKAMNSKEDDTVADGEIASIINRVGRFYDEFIEKIRCLETMEVDGVRLFRQK